MTAPRRDSAEPTTPDLHDQWAADRLDLAEEVLVDLVGAFFAAAEGPDGPDVPPAVTP
ncbi:hypothetical protein ACIGN6_31600 [Streptomyces sp. NPDC053792]|uniref:hypothetical protein n=1 Tax=Streptomyces sp. NPDC053792 TaxID=3365716 RepID=UPI0037CE2886